MNKKRWKFYPHKLITSYYDRGDGLNWLVFSSPIVFSDAGSWLRRSVLVHWDWGCGLWVARIPHHVSI